MAIMVRSSLCSAQLLLGYENVDDLVSFPQGADSIGDEIEGLWKRRHGQRMQFGLRQRCRVYPLAFVDCFSYFPNALAAETAIVSATAVFIHQRSQHVVGTGAVSQSVEEVEGYAVIPPGKGQQVVVGGLAEQHHLLPACRYYPRQRVVIEGIMRYALLVATCAEPYLI